MNRLESEEKMRLRFTLLPCVKKQIFIFQEKEKVIFFVRLYENI